ncbi:HIT family protein [bacterium]|nr:HIT family protein [bacterium]
MNCPFCRIEEKQLWKNGNLVFVLRDSHPVAEGHLLIIPKKHRTDYFELTNEELSEINELLKVCRNEIMSDDPSVKGFNIGANCGEAAGQTVFHCHIHLIPRRKGDDRNPRGGVRAVIDGKKSY